MPLLIYRSQHVIVYEAIPKLMSLRPFLAAFSIVWCICEYAWCEGWWWKRTNGWAPVLRERHPSYTELLSHCCRIEVVNSCIIPWQILNVSMNFAVSTLLCWDGWNWAKDQDYSSPRVFICPTYFIWSSSPLARRASMERWIYDSWLRDSTSTFRPSCTQINHTCFHLYMCKIGYPIDIDQVYLRY